MLSPTLQQLVPILQLSISPVILISGVGLLLLTLTNRFGRLVDRSRALNQDIAGGRAPERVGPMRTQIDILLQRANLLRLSITLGAITVLLVGVLMLALFISALFGFELGGLIVAVFCVALVALIGSMLAFIRDMNMAMFAVRLEVKE